MKGGFLSDLRRKRGRKKNKKEGEDPKMKIQGLEKYSGGTRGL